MATHGEADQNDCFIIPRNLIDFIKYYFSFRRDIPMVHFCRDADSIDPVFFNGCSTQKRSRGYMCFPRTFKGYQQIITVTSDMVKNQFLTFEDHHNAPTL